MRWIVLVAAYLVIWPTGCAASVAPAGSRANTFRDLGPAELDARAHLDAVLLASWARGIDMLVAELERNRGVFERDAQTPLNPDERELVLGLFEQVIAYSVGLDQMAAFHFEFWRVDVIRQPVRHARHFAIGFAAYCLKVRLGLLFADLTLNRPQFEKLLDEGSPEHGLPPGIFGRLKWNVVHVEAISRILAAHQYHKLLKRTSYREFSGELGMPPVLRVLDDSYDRVKRRLLEAGAKLFTGNALDILKDSGQEVWFPVQQNVAELMGDTKVRRLQTMLISEEQVHEAVRISQPGDILVERRNWYLSNIALPGFWPHTALWLGTAEDLEELLDLEPDVRAAYGGPFTEALAQRYPEAWEEYTSLDVEGHRHRIIEAMSEGVVFTSAEHSVRADYVASMRPRLSRLEVARAIERAFGYAGRPYDFDFDFYTDASLVCSELVYKAYEPREEARGLTFQLESIAGRMTLGPNSMVRQFQRDYGTTRQQLDFVWFLDGRERHRDAVWGDLHDFLGSHRRFKWDIAQK